MLLYQITSKSEEQMTTYGSKEISFLGENYGNSKVVDGDTFPGIIEKEKFSEEWNSAKYYL